jgi:transposase
VSVYIYRHLQFCWDTCTQNDSQQYFFLTCYVMFFKRYHPFDIQKALHVYRIHKSLRVASSIVNISKSTIQRWNKRFPGGVINRRQKTTKQSKYRKQTCKYIEIVHSIMTNLCTRRVTLKHFQKLFMTEYDTQISIYSISRLFAKMQLKLKRIRDRKIYCAKEKITFQSECFSQNIHGIPLHSIISIDESGFTTHGDHGSCFGYFFKGELPVSTKYNFRWQKCSLAMAIGIGGIMHHCVRTSAFDKQSFVEFFKHLMSVKEPHHKYVVMDNIQFHHSKEVKQIACDNDVTIIYTPAYSPQFNPIEHAFSNIKRMFREYIDEGVEFKKAVSQSIHCAYSKSYESTFRHCFIHETSKIV